MHHDDIIDPAEEIMCQWFARCTNHATYLEPHPILNLVPICDRCKLWLDNQR